MKIRIEVDLTPSELRALIGLPDVAGLQEDMIEYLRERVAHGVEGFDPTGFVRENIQSSRAWKRLMAITRGEEEATEKKTTRSGAKKSASTRRKSSSTARKPKSSSS